MTPTATGTPLPRTKLQLVVMGIVVIALAALALHLLQYKTFFFDDSFISLRYADRLRSGKGLTWTDGERVEGYSNLLWVLLIAGIGLLRDELIEPTRALGVFCTSAAVVCLVFAYRPRYWRDVSAPLFGALSVVLSGPIAAWTFGGLEAPLILALLGGALLLLYPRLEAGDVPVRRALQVGALLGACALTRPDGVLFTLGLALGLVLATGRRGVKAASAMSGVSALFFLGQLVFRKAYYGTFLPNTSSKLGASADRLRQGFEYATTSLNMRLGFVLVALGALALIALDERARRRMLLVLPSVLLWLAYVVVVGGDFMPQSRHLVPALYLLAWIATEGIAWLLCRGRWGPLLASVVALVSLVHYGVAQQRSWAKRDANNSAWYWEGRSIGRFFKDAFGAQHALLAVDAAGSLPYYYGGPALDMLGLNDRYIATHPPAKLVGPMGHQLGDGKYVWSRRPDLVVFHLPKGRATPMWQGDWELYRQPGFTRSYRLMHYETVVPERVEGKVYVRVEDGPLGVQRGPTRIAIPGYLLATGPKTPATFDAEGQLGTRLHRVSARQSFLIPAGRWRAKVQCSGAVFLRVQSGRAANAGLGHADFELARESMVSFTVSASISGTAYVHEIVLEPR
ncbi:MAG: hypothetical protein R3B13_06370 [Polyangiaceae bacterium]